MIIIRTYPTSQTNHTLLVPSEDSGRALVNGILFFHGSLWLLERSFSPISASRNGFKYESSHFLEPFFRERDFCEEPPSVLFRCLVIILSPLQHHVSADLPHSGVHLGVEQLSAYFAERLLFCIALGIKDNSLRGAFKCCRKTSSKYVIFCVPGEAGKPFFLNQR